MYIRGRLTEAKFKSIRQNNLLSIRHAIYFFKKFPWRPENLSQVTSLSAHLPNFNPACLIKTAKAKKCLEYF